MALRWIEGFETFATVLTTNIDSYLEYKYSSAASNTLDAGRISGFSVKTANEIIWPTFTPLSTWVMGVGYKRNFSLLEGVMSFMDSSTNQVELRVLGSGNLAVYRNGSFLGQGTATLSNSVWYYIEMKTFIDPLGSVEVKINGATDINLINVNTQATGNNTVNTFKVRAISNSSYFDDIYICDTTGIVNNDFLGDNIVEGIVPTANGTTIQWTPLVAPNFSQVNEIPPDDTSYVFTSTITDVDTYVFSDLSVIQSGIKGLQTNVISRKDSAGAREIAPMIRSGGTDYTGSTVSVANNYTTVVQIFEEDPDTSALWTVPGVNAAEFGQKMIS